MRHKLIPLLFLMLLGNTLGGEPPTEQSVAVNAIVDSFHDALRRGDAKTTMELLAPDAVILESGYAQTRAEYERGHLKEDIAFAQAIPGARAVLRVVVEGDEAWIASTSHSKGSFRDREINSTGTELMVLSKSARGWRIRAIHWSSHDVKSPK